MPATRAETSGIDPVSCRAVFAPPDALLPSLAAAIGVGVPLFAAKARGRTYALFALVLVGLSFPAGVILALRLIELSGPRFGPFVGWAFVYGIAATGLHMASLVRARLRARWVRYAMSVPGMTMLALGALALPFLLVLAPLRGLLGLLDARAALAALAYADWLPVLAIVHALATSFGARREFVRIDLAQGRQEDRRTRAGEPLLHHQQTTQAIAVAGERCRYEYGRVVHPSMLPADHGRMQGVDHADWRRLPEKRARCEVRSARWGDKHLPDCSPVW